MDRLRWVALGGILLALLTAGCLQLGEPAEDAPPTDLPPEASSAIPAEEDRSLVPGSAQLGLEWTRERWGGQDQIPVVDETRTVRAPAEVHAAGRESTWLGSAQVFRPGPGLFVLPGTTQVDVTVDWETQPEGLPLEADLLVGTADENPSWLNDEHERIDEVQAGDTVTLNVDAEDWDDPYQDASLWWFGLNIEPETVSVPTEVELSVQATAHRDGEIPSTLVAYAPWQGQDRIQLLDGSERSNDILMDGPGSSRLYHCPDRCDGLVWGPPAGPLVPDEADTVRATIRWEGDLPSRPVLDWVVEPDASGSMELVDAGKDYRTFETDVPNRLADSIWQNRTAWYFRADLETAGQDPDAYSGSMTLSAEAIRSPTPEREAAATAAPPPTSPDSERFGAWAAWSAGIAAAGFTLWLASKLRWGSVLATLYSRIPDDEVLEHPRRHRIYEIVKDVPGVHFRELRRRLDTGAGILEHHVRKLADANLVTVEETDSHRCFFEKGRFDRDQRRALAGMKAHGARRVANAIERRADASLSEIAEEAGLAVSTVCHHVQRLEDLDVVEAERVGNAKRLRLTQLGDGVLDRL